METSGRNRLLRTFSASTFTVKKSDGMKTKMEIDKHYEEVDYREK